MRRRTMLFLAGPTASGKTDVASCLAKRLNAEIISCDSMQIYKQMDIITSKPAKALRKNARHHLMDFLPPTKEYNVSEFRREAIKAMKDILKRGKIPLFAGGAGLYMSVLIDGIFETKTHDEKLRKRLYKLAESKGSAYLHAKLQKVDAEAALKIHPNDIKRVIRALEVFKITGKPITLLQKQRKGLNRDYDIKIFGLSLPREELYARIDNRVEKMFKKGLISEVRKLLKLKLSKTASRGIGISELKGYFQGAYDLARAKYLIKRNTRHYAKRQLAWFRKDKRIKWIKAREKDNPLLISKKIIRDLGKTGLVPACR